ncbi:sensor histidine kinase [Chitinimonas sp.]|uniref:sensor histidine kinase n=1 Tax=Chitinimonas sp. TaxID=1934313 RepID=UPI0035AD81E5
MSANLPPTFHQAASRPQRWLWVWPRVALLCFGLAVISLLIYTRSEERAAQRSVLINDVLWAEQNLHFQFEQTEDRARALALAAANGAIEQGGFHDRAILMVNGEAGVIGLATVDLGGQLRLQAGASLPERDLWQATLEYAAATGRPAYSRPIMQGSDAVLVLAVADGDARVLVLISLAKLINHQIPWWFATKYRVSILDIAGNTIASKSRIDAGREALSHQIPLEPPGQGLSMRVTAYRMPGNTIQQLLSAAVLVLAAAVLYSWWRLRRHVQGRLTAEAALQSEHAFRKAMEDSLTVGMRARDMEGRIVYVNPAFCKMLGFSEQQLLGAGPPYPYWDPDGMERHQRQHEEVRAGRAPLSGYEARFQHRDGHKVDVLVYTAPLIDAQGVQRGWMSSLIDVTERRRIEALSRAQEEKLQQVARLTAMGEMASTLAHELNQPLMALSSYASAAKQLANQPEQRSLLDSTLDKLSEQSQRAAQVVRRIREFVRKRSPELESCQLQTLIDETLALIGSDAQSQGIRLVVHMPDKPLSLHADRILLEQALLNLLRNAMDASAGMPLERREVVLQIQVSEAQIEVAVIDRGCGIAPEQAAHLFEAFHTTKPLGMGMGLSICRSIIEKHHGTLAYRPNPDGGAIFHFSLPR